MAFAYKFYTDDSDGKLVELARDDPNANVTVPNPIAAHGATYIWWPDLIAKQVSGNSNVFMCPGVKVGVLGIGMNHHELGKWIPTGNNSFKEFEIARPEDTIVLADAGQMSLTSVPSPTLNPDNWQLQTPMSGTLLWRTPSNTPYYERTGVGISCGERVVNRHSGRAAAIFVNGVADFRPASQFGFQDPSTGATIAVGDSRALWDRQ